MSRAGPLSDGSLIKDIYLFTQLCQFLKAGGKRSFSQAAFQLQVSQTRLQDCLTRLEKEYGATLIKTYARSADSEITEAGEAVLKQAADLPGLLDRIRNEVVRVSSGNGEQLSQIRVGASQFLLAQVFPAALSGFLAKQERPESIRIECEEVYDSDKLVEKIGKDLDFAVVWSYPEKIEKIRDTAHLTCTRSRRSLDAVLVFGKNHDRFRAQLESGVQPWVNIEDLEGESLFRLVPEHQPLFDLLPASLKQRGPTSESRTFSSIIGSIRAGMPVVAIVAGVYQYLDWFRRDGDLYFLPLRSRRTGKPLSIGILYVYEGTQPRSWKEDKLPELASGISLNKLTPLSQKFLRHIDETVLPGLLQQSGWFPSAPSADSDGRRLLLALERIEEFTDAYFVSATKVGLSEPLWYPSQVSWKKSPHGPSQPTYRGELHIRKSPRNMERVYELEGELVGKQVFCIKGHLREGRAGRTDRDSFVVNLNMVSPSGDHLIGILSGRDDEDATGMSSTFILCRKGSTVPSWKITHELQAARVRTLLRIDACPVGQAMGSEQ